MKKLNEAIAEVNYSYSNVPYYQSLLNQELIDRLKANPKAGLGNIPLSSKVDYRKNFPKGILARGFSPQHPMVTSSRSSGTTGERTITLEIGMFLLQRALRTASVNPEISRVMGNKDRKIVRYAAPNCSDVECANPNSELQDRLLPDNTLVLPVYHDLMTTPDHMLDKAIEEIKVYKPDMFYVDPTHFAFLLLAYKKRKQVPPQIPVLLSYTAMTECSRRIIAEFYSEEYICQLLSSTEFGWTAMECSEGHLHINDDSFFVEYLNIGADSCHERDFKELCLTSLDKGACPHIRYKTGDIVTVIPGKCECGSDRARIQVEGRFSHFMTIDGLPLISPRQVDQLIGGPKWLNFYQLEQVREKEFTLKLMVNEAYSANAEQGIIEKLKSVFNTPVKIETRLVEYISTERSGKFQAVKRA